VSGETYIILYKAVIPRCNSFLAELRMADV